MHTNMHIFMYHVCTCMLFQYYRYVCTYVCKLIRVQTCICLCIMYVHVCIFIYMCICLFMYTHVYIQIHAHAIIVKRKLLVWYTLWVRWHTPNCVCVVSVRACVLVCEYVKWPSHSGSSNPFYLPLSHPHTFSRAHCLSLYILHSDTLNACTRKHTCTFTLTFLQYCCTIHLSPPFRSTGRLCRRDLDRPSSPTLAALPPPAVPIPPFGLGISNWRKLIWLRLLYHGACVWPWRGGGDRIKVIGRACIHKWWLYLCLCVRACWRVEWCGVSVHLFSD